jgi:cyanophycin synthetase
MAMIENAHEEHFLFLKKFVAKLSPWFLKLRLDQAVPPLLRAVAALKLGKLNTEPKDYDIKRTKVLWEAARRLDIKLYKFEFLGQPTQIFVSYYKNRCRVFMGLPRPYGSSSAGFDWMDNKAIMNQRFAAAGIPIARGSKVSSESATLKVFQGLTPPVIVKPIIGSLSRHTTLHITTEQELLEGFRKAKQLAPWVVVQEELKGLGIYRPTVIGGRLVAIVNKEPPHVIGDGKHTLRELVNTENQNPARQGPIFHEIPTNEKATAYLTKTNLTWGTVPKPGQVVVLSEKTSRTIGGSITDYTETAHPDNIALFEKAAQVLGDPIVGIDFIIGDITRSWKDQDRCGIIECNSLPFIDLHNYPLVGKPRDPAGAIWRLVYPELGPGSV